MKHYNKEIYDGIFGNCDRSNTSVHNTLGRGIRDRTTHPPYQPFPGKNPTRIYLSWGLKSPRYEDEPVETIKPMGSYFGKIGFFVPKEIRKDGRWAIRVLLIVDQGGLIGYYYFGQDYRTPIYKQYFPSWGINIAHSSTFIPSRENSRKRLFKINGIYRYFRPYGTVNEGSSLRSVVSNISIRDAVVFGVNRRLPYSSASEERILADANRLYTELGYNAEGELCA